MSTLKTAIEKNNGVVAVARRLGISPSRLGNWVNRGVPIRQCARVSAVLDIPLKQVRPDVDWDSFQRAA